MIYKGKSYKEDDPFVKSIRGELFWYYDSGHTINSFSSYNR